MEYIIVQETGIGFRLFKITNPTMFWTKYGSVQNWGSVKKPYYTEEVKIKNESLGVGSFEPYLDRIDKLYFVLR